MANNDLTTRRKEYKAGREIKDSAHYAYITNGITLDGSKFANGELVLEGTCLAMNNTTRKYEKYSETAAGTFEAGYSNPVILDESVLFIADDTGANPDLTAGQVLLHGRVHEGMLIGVTEAFKTATGTAIQYTSN